MINYPAVFTVALNALLKLIQDMQTGTVTVDTALARIAALEGKDAADRAEDRAAIAAKFGKNTPGI